MHFGIKIIDENNMEIEFADRAKNFPIINFLIEFLAWIELIGKKQKSREEHIEDVLVELGKDLSNFQIIIQKIDKTIEEYVRLLKITKQEYQKLFQENKISKDKI